MSKKLIILIVALLIIGTGYFIYQSLKPVSKQEAVVSGEVYTNSTYGYSIVIPKSWKGKYFIEEKDYLTSFNFNSASDLKYNLFSIVVYPNSEWQKIKNEPGFHGVEITTKDDLVFAYVISLDNPYTGEEGDEYQKMAGDVNDIIKTFKIK